MGDHVFAVGPGFGSDSVQRQEDNTEPERKRETDRRRPLDMRIRKHLPWNNVSGMGFKESRVLDTLPFHTSILSCTKEKLKFSLVFCFLFF